MWPIHQQSCYVQRFRKCIYKKIHYLTLRSMSHEMFLSTLYIIWLMHLQILKLLCPTVEEHMYLQENTLFDLDPLCSQGHIKFYPVPFTLFDLCKCIVWSCYVQGFMRRCIYKKIHHELWHKMLLGTLYIMWLMHLQSLKWLRPMV